MLVCSEGSIDRTEAEALQTTPEEAPRFIRDTQIDILAVAIGSAFKYNVPKLFGAGIKSGYALAHEKIKLFLNGKTAAL